MSTVTVDTTVYISKYSNQNFNIAKQTNTVGFTFKPSKLPSLVLIATDSESENKFDAIAAVLEESVDNVVNFETVNGEEKGSNQYRIRILSEGKIKKYPIGGSRGSRSIDLLAFQECLLNPS